MIYNFEPYNQLPTLDRAKRVLAEFKSDLTPRQKEMLTMGDMEAWPILTREEWYERICLQRKEEALTKTIALHEGMPAPESAFKPYGAPKFIDKKFEPVRYR